MRHYIDIFELVHEFIYASKQQDKRLQEIYLHIDDYGRKQEHLIALANDILMYLEKDQSYRNEFHVPISNIDD